MPQLFLGAILVGFGIGAVLGIADGVNGDTETVDKMLDKTLHLFW
jgi:hypothetical protein